jgi:predicted nucleic acid-binding protein
MVPAVSAWHEHHERAANEIERRLSRGEAMVLAAPALVESYSVLSRLPSPYRLPAADALTILDATFMSAAEIVAIDGAAYRALLRRAPSDGVVGGRIYDSIIVACARAANVATLLTFNERHFRPFAGNGLDIVVPG